MSPQIKRGNSREYCDNYDRIFGDKFISGTLGDFLKDPELDEIDNLGWDDVATELEKLRCIA